MSSIGPTLPPHLQKAYENDTDSNSDEEDLYGPALPPHLRQPMPNKVSRISIEKEATIAEDSDSASVDERVIGPLPANCESSEEHSLHVDVEHRALKMKRKLLGADEDEESKQPKREDWMIELPELKRKNFGLGPRAFNRSEKPEVVGRDQWTSTPTTKASVSKEKDDCDAEMRKQYLEQKRNQKLEKVVAEHDKTKRSESLLNMHQKELKKKKDNLSKLTERKPFDRDEDLKLNRLDDAKRKSLIKKSQELNSKFKIGNQNLASSGLAKIVTTWRITTMVFFVDEGSKSSHIQYGQNGLNENLKTKKKKCCLDFHFFPLPKQWWFSRFPHREHTYTITHLPFICSTHRVRRLDSGYRILPLIGIVGPTNDQSSLRPMLVCLTEIQK